MEKLLPARTPALLVHLHKMLLEPQNLITPTCVLTGNDTLKLKVPRSEKWIYDKSPLHRGDPMWNELAPDVQRLLHEAFLKAH